MFLQIDHRLDDWINKEGCLYMSCLFLLNKVYGLKLSTAKINIYLQQLKEAGAFTEDMDLIWDKFFSFFGYPVEVAFRSATYKPKSNEYSIMKWYNPRTKLSHFVVGTGKHVYYDPEGLSVTCAEGEPTESRIITFK
jgi:hypothetical protein